MRGTIQSRYPHWLRRGDLPLIPNERAPGYNRQTIRAACTGHHTIFEGFGGGTRRSGGCSFHLGHVRHGWFQRAETNVIFNAESETILALSFHSDHVVKPSFQNFDGLSQISEHTKCPHCTSSEYLRHKGMFAKLSRPVKIRIAFPCRVQFGCNRCITL